MRRLAIVLFAAAVSTAIVTAQAGLDGLWGGDVRFGPRLRGTLTLEDDGSRWVARLGGFEAATNKTGEEIHVTFPGGLGTLRARLVDGGAIIRGFWVQPGATSSPYATPVTLSQAAPHAWRGVVSPLDEVFSLYLSISRDADGGLRGAFSNPERNWTGGAPSFHVARDGDRIRLTDPRTGAERHALQFDAERGVMSFFAGGLIALTRRTADQAVGFRPWSPTALPYRYRTPLPASDGWSVAAASSVGLNERTLESLVQRLGTMDAASRLRVHSVVVARGGRLVLDEYFYGFGPDRPHDLRSASKTFTSILAGVAMDRHSSLDVSTSIVSLLPPPGSAPADPRRSSITLGQLLTHTSGLACDDNDDDSPGQEDRMQTVASDWYGYALALPMAHDPGTKYAYCSAGMNLVGGAIAKASRTWIPDYFDQHLARPLGIAHYAMNLMPSGEAYAGGGVHMRPRDLLKFGQLFLNGGTWRGQRIVSKRWVEASTARQIDVPDGSSDGYGWHRHAVRAGTRTFETYEASGNGGQFLIVVPELELVVVFTGGNYGQYPVWRSYREELLPAYILAATETPR